MANLTEILEALSTREQAIKPDDLAKELRASVEGTRKQLNRLKQREFVEGDSKEGWYITDTGRAELDKGAVHPTMIDEGVTPRDMFEAIGRRIGISPDRITLAADQVWSQNYEDITWVWEALLQVGIRKDLARSWSNSWRAQVHKGIPPELEAELTGTGKEEKVGTGGAAAGQKPTEGRSFILQDDMPVYVGKDLGDLFYQDALELARIKAGRGAREAISTQPQQMGPDDIIKIVNAVREWGGQDGQAGQKSYIVTQGEDGAIVQEAEPGKPVVLSPPQASKPVTYLVNPEGVVKEMQPGEPIVIKQQAPPTPTTGKTFIVRQTSEGIVAEEHDLGKPIIINNPAPAAGMPPMMPFPVMDGEGKAVVGEDGKPVYANLEPMMNWWRFQGEQRRSDERHTALMGLVQTAKEILPDGVQALREAAAEAKGKVPQQQKQPYECGECHSKFTLEREPVEGENVKCPNCGLEWSKEVVTET